MDEEDLTAAAAPGGGGRGGAPAADRMPDVKIEWDGLQRRARRLTRMNGNIGNIVSSPDGRTAAFGSGLTLYTITLDTGTLTRVAQGCPRQLPRPGIDAPRRRRVAAASEASATSSGRATDVRSTSARDDPSWPRRSAALTTTAAAPAAGGGGGTWRTRRRWWQAAGAAPAAAVAAGEPRRVNFTVHVEMDHRAERKGNLSRRAGAS